VAFWAVARLQGHRERLALHCLGLAGYPTYLPRIRARRVIGNRKVSEAAPLFPGYCFLTIELQWHVARWAPGVINIIMDGERPARVPDQIIRALRGRERGGLITLPTKPPLGPPFVPGDRLRIRSGPFTGLNGLYAGMAPHDRVLVLLTMLGGERTVAFAKDDVAIAR
jgi:transcriptional antiterminator RfaH